MTTTNPVPLLTEFLNAAEAAKFSRLSYSSLKRLARKGIDVGLRKLGRRVVFDATVLRQFLASAVHPPTVK